MEIKQEISSIINTLPAEILNDLLNYLKAIQKSSKKEVNLSSNLKKIIEEDRELLAKLAQ